MAQVDLLLDCLPVLKEQNSFVLKGGTAINFFIHDLPRLSVDIDLTFIKTLQREQAIAEIESALQSMGERIVRRNRRYHVKELHTKEGVLHKLVISNGNVRVKIEPNFIMRGTLLPTTLMDVKPSVEREFERDIKQIPLLSMSELYAGKLCAALSRQHPRDLFDIKKLMENHGLTREIRESFVIYLVCSPRPIHELLQPNRISLNQVYENEFINMTEDVIALEELLMIRDQLVHAINAQLSDNERQFILSVKKGKPDYSLMPFNQLEELPALKWKLINIQRMNKSKHATMLKKLESVLAV